MSIGQAGRKTRTSHAQVASKTELEATTECGAVYGGDGRHGQVLELRQRGTEIDEELVDLGMRHGASLDEVGASTERAGCRGVYYESANAKCGAYARDSV